MYFTPTSSAMWYIELCTVIQFFCITVKITAMRSFHERTETYLSSNIKFKHNFVGSPTVGLVGNYRSVETGAFFENSVVTPWYSEQRKFENP